MTDTTTIALNKLTPWKGNVRKTGAADGIDELAASIVAHGQLQALVIREGKRGKYEIIAGRRRFLALSLLAKQGLIQPDHPVNCTLAANEADPSELSLAENVVRVAMHPADQFEAFSKLVDAGTSTADVAARFGVAEKLIAQRMKLGRLNPVILDAYRQGEIDLDIAQAFAISDDQAAQERVFTETPSWHLSAHAVRRALTEGEVRATDKRVRFLSLPAYEAAGGDVRRDLFGDDSDAFVLDSALLDRLVAEKLKSLAAEIAAEGWLWTEIAVELGHDILSKFGREYPDSVPLSEERQAEFDCLSSEYDELIDSDDDGNADRLAVIEQRIDELNALGQCWSDCTRSIAGAVISLNHDGSVSVDRGLVRPKDVLPDDISDEPNTVSLETAEGLSPRLIEDLTAQKTAAIGAELMRRPDITIVSVVHCLALDVLYPGSGTESCLKLSVRSAQARSVIAKPELCKALTVIDEEKECFGDRIPGNPEALWNWLLALSRDELLDLLAYIAGTAVDAIQRKGVRDDSRIEHANVLADALQLDMTAWFSPTAEGYFSRVNRSQILAAIDEVNGSHAPALEKLKKSELAVRAEQLLENKSWLPEPLRMAANDNGGDTQVNAAE